MIFCLLPPSVGHHHQRMIRHSPPLAGVGGGTTNVKPAVKQLADVKIYIIYTFKKY